MTYTNPCTVPRCRRLIHANGLCRAHLWRLERFGDTFPSVPIGALGPARTNLVGVCKCPVSRPNPKCCTGCGYPSVHRMAPAVRDRALTKWPSLRGQVIEAAVTA